jgi:hypothetical protein
MGNEPSEAAVPEPPKGIRSSNSYFGRTQEIGDADLHQIEDTIREARLERLARTIPSMRPSKSQAAGLERAKEAKLRTAVSLGTLQPSIKIARGVYLLSFGFRSDVPGRFILAAENLINSIGFSPCERVTVNLPIPDLANFIVEIVPHSESLTASEDGFTAVTKHVLSFTAARTVDGVQFTFVGQKLFAGDHVYSMQLGTELPEEVLSADELCLICLENRATVSVSNCGHSVFCERCMVEKAVRVHHCPICNALA